jgi:sugar O-acyltransferase (sialic acid O-acetyltransferase NeuD family)
VRPVAIYVYGAGGHGKVVAEAARFGYLVRGFLDDDEGRWGEDWHGLPVVGGRDELSRLEEGAEVALGVGKNRERAEVAAAVSAAGRILATIVHPKAVVAQGVFLGEGSFVAPLALVHPDARLGRGCIVNSGAVVEHDCRLGSFVHVSPRAALGGGVQVAEGAHVGMGALLVPGVCLGAWSVLGAGAVMLHSFPASVTAVGVPARVLRPSGSAA